MSEFHFDAERFLQQLAGTALAPCGEALAEAVLSQGKLLRHGHLPLWLAAVASLPPVSTPGWHVSEGVMCTGMHCSDVDLAGVQASLVDLMPWRKGPYRIGPVSIDTEWRSDWKWDRIEPHLRDPNGRLILDVGCGNGYHLWRMRAAGARQVLGIDPSLLYVQQFAAIQHFAADPSVQLLPLPMEALPGSLQLFDTVFSMGVLYHRREPLAHLAELHGALKGGGELVLETLHVEGDDDSSLTISDRYANMRNVYELPTLRRLKRWLTDSGFKDPQVVSSEVTSRREQRRTKWMSGHSLEQALNPADPAVTVEGYPRPRRTIVLATV